MAQRLPSQCIRAIFSHLVFPTTKLEGRCVSFYREASRAEFAACALVCRAWNVPATEALYRQIHPKCVEGHRADKFLAILEKTPYLAGLVQISHVTTPAREIRGDSIMRILQVLPNLRSYTLYTRPGHLRLPIAMLPTSQNSSLKTLALVALPRRSFTSLSPSVFEGLPSSIENLIVDSVNMSSVESNFPNLRRLRLLGGGLCDPPCFGDDSTVTSLYLYEPSSTDLSSILTSLGSHLKSLRLESSTKWEAVSTSALTSLECLDLVGSCTQMEPRNFPPTLKKVIWEAMNRARVFEMLILLSKPDYLPNLRSIPALFWTRFGAKCELEGQYSLSVYEKLRRHSFKVLCSRGLLTHLTDRTDWNLNAHILFSNDM